MRPGMETAREESALNMFRQMDLKGKVKDDLQLKTTHQNTISTMRVYEEAGGNVQKFSSGFISPNHMLDDADPTPASGVDGRVVIWAI
jgi:actin related protein 2/3 complex, subunit 1A/1B